MAADGEKGVHFFLNGIRSRPLLAYSLYFVGFIMYYMCLVTMRDSHETN